MPLAFNHHHHQNKSLASPISEINSPTKPTNPTTTTKRSISRKNLFAFANHHFQKDHHQSRRESEEESSIRNHDLPPQLPSRNLRSSVFLLNGVLQSSELDFTTTTTTTTSNHQIIKSVDRPNRSNIRPASWILMEDGLYAPPQKHSSSSSSHHHDPSKSHDLYDETDLGCDDSNSKTSFINILHSDDQTKSDITNNHQIKTLLPTNHLKPLSKPIQQSTTTHSLLSINPTPTPNSSYSPLAAFLGSPTKPSASEPHSTSNSFTNLKPTSSNSLLATFLNSGNQSAVITKRDGQPDLPESGSIHQTKLVPTDDPLSNSLDHHLSKDNLITGIKTFKEPDPLPVRLNDSPKNVQSLETHEDRILLPSNTIQRSQSNQSDFKAIPTRQEVAKPNSRSENSIVEISQPHSLITPPVSVTENDLVGKGSIGSELEKMDRQASTDQSSTDEFQSIESLSNHSTHSNSQPNMKRPVTSVYIQDFSETVYHSEQDGRCSTLSSPSTDTNSTRSESFPITPNSERIRVESDPLTSKTDEMSHEEVEEVKAIVPPNLEEILLSFPNRILKRVLTSLTYMDFFNLSLVSTNLREGFSNGRETREVILERYLGSLGYVRKSEISSKMTEKISLKDLQGFYVGMEFGSEEISRIARLIIGRNGRGIEKNTVRIIREAARAYNRILVHLREHPPQKNKNRGVMGMVSHLGNRMDSVWKIGRAGVLRVWVPTRESWMSNEEVVECERELWRSQVWPWLKKGDICWNTGLGEFANEGKLIYDGKYLRDLSFEFDSIGHLPSWLNMMSFPPVYYHRIIESSTPSPIFYLDLSGFGTDVHRKMRLCKDQIEMSSPITRYRVQRWVYRTMIEILPGTTTTTTNRGDGKKKIEETVDLGWAGRVVIEVEGTSECARELLKRCSREWSVEIEQKNGRSGSGTIHLTPWRIIREKCGPGKMWIRPVLDDEKV